jgi:hypothetical protein
MSRHPPSPDWDDPIGRFENEGGRLLPTTDVLREAHYYPPTRSLTMKIILAVLIVLPLLSILAAVQATRILKRHDEPY